MLPLTISLRSEPLSDCTPLQCFISSRQSHGPADTYLLESLSGPDRDVKVTIVGFNKVAQVSVKGDTLSIVGTDFFVKLLHDWTTDCVHLRRHKDSLTIEPGHTWDVLRSLHDRFAVKETTGLGFLTFFSYDTAWHIESLPRLIHDDLPNLPEICLVLHRGVITFDLVNSTAVLEQLVVQGLEPVSAVELQQTFARVMEPPEIPEVPVPDRVTDTFTKEQFVKAARACLEHIAAGDIYQIQLGHEVRILSKADPFGIYLRLRRINPSPYMYFVPFAGSFVLGTSPELFVRRQGEKVTMRPIAGTMRRSGDEVRDAQIARTLRADEKERAEHIMLVDLCRNDLGRICKAGTLEVDEQMVVERYSHVLHLVSNVQADLDDDQDIYAVIAATFPAGTMTGTPKIRAMELIESFEATRRSLYAGALGMINLNGDAVLALCIRTALYFGGGYSIRASAGLVADSQPESEWQETLNKLAAGYIAITGADFHESYRGGECSTARGSRQ